MITNDAELSQTMEQLERMYRALAALRRDVFPVNPITPPIGDHQPHRISTD